MSGDGGGRPLAAICRWVRIVGTERQHLGTDVLALALLFVMARTRLAILGSLVALAVPTGCTSPGSTPSSPMRPPGSSAATVMTDWQAEPMPNGEPTESARERTKRPNGEPTESARERTKRPNGEPTESSKEQEKRPRREHPATAPIPVGRLREMQRRDVQRAIARAVARALGAAVLLIVGYYVVPLGNGSQLDVILRIAGAGVGIVAIVTMQVIAVGRARFPQLRAIEALTVTVTVVVVAFALAYVNMSRHDPDAFNEVLGRTSSLYFTLTTLATVGYGDIHAKTDPARIVVMVQMVCNVAVIGATAKFIIASARHRLTSTRDDPF